MKITVNITRDVLYRNLGGQPVHAGLHVNKVLRERGIPVVGTLWIETVESGSLTQYQANGEFVYVWDSEPIMSTGMPVGGGRQAASSQSVYNDDDEI